MLCEAAERVRLSSPSSFWLLSLLPHYDPPTRILPRDTRFQHDFDAEAEEEEGEEGEEQAGEVGTEGEGGEFDDEEGRHEGVEGAEEGEDFT